MIRIRVSSIDFRRLPMTTKQRMDVLRAVANTYLRIARQRIESRGLGSDGQPMTYAGKGESLGAYSKAHALRRSGKAQKRPPKKQKDGSFSLLTENLAKAGRGKTVTGGRTISIRTLVYTGKMLGARIVKQVTRAAVVVGWATGEQGLKASGNEALHPFVAPTQDERISLSKRIKEQALKHILSNQRAARAQMKGRNK